MTPADYRLTRKLKEKNCYLEPTTRLDLAVKLLSQRTGRKRKRCIKNPTWDKPK